MLKREYLLEQIARLLIEQAELTDDAKKSLQNIDKTEGGESE